MIISLGNVLNIMAFNKDGYKDKIIEKINEP
jgi:hypothetical protein